MDGNKKNIDQGIYLVIDPGMEKPELLLKLALALKAGLAAVQIWNHWPEDADKSALIPAVSALCRAAGVPLLIGNDWELLMSSRDLDGVHFDAVPENFEEIKERVARPFLAGITCSGELSTVEWANSNGFDYISFCAIYPSSSSANCPIVSPETINTARRITGLPLFVSGGITPDNIPELKKQALFNGVAVISGIMKADDPLAATQAYKNAFTLKNDNR
ncbi:thiamine phosphate synthase [Mucilaginibacter conchicola]|uniref:Thiamine phosphate synthase n=1 Tax=Mucilaginibacter conchicola TaxID=2303333 RepID=A0A372NLS0_9SPHI|nr:thiamine phosphate synthase [Mucilaginibacter conchicola]RFZ89902.1 thiamine phosphate synthase [Mucilaginibacter conchicola]